MKSTESLQAGHLEDVLKKKGFNNNQLMDLFKASSNANEYQIMLMDVLVKVSKGELNEMEADRQTKKTIESYRVLRANQYPL